MRSDGSGRLAGSEPGGESQHADRGGDAGRVALGVVEDVREGADGLEGQLLDVGEGVGGEHGCSRKRAGRSARGADQGHANRLVRTGDSAVQGLGFARGGAGGTCGKTRSCC